MNIILNGKPHSTQDRITIHDLIDTLKRNNSTNFAIAVNFAIVSRSRYHEFWLNENDKVEIVTAFQGG